MRLRSPNFLPALRLALLAPALFVPALSAQGMPAAAGDCEQCHAAGGASLTPEIPVIGGMSAFYLEEQLLAYQEKRRPCVATSYPDGPKKGEATDMCAAVQALSKAQLTELATYFAEQPFVAAKQPVNSELAAQGGAIHETHCAKCHSEGGGLAFDDAGILAGQWRHYLELTFKEYRSGQREMTEKMKPKIEALSDADVQALVEFYISQEPSQ